MTYLITLDSRFGSLTLAWERREAPTVVQIFLSKPGAPSEERAKSRYPASVESSDPHIDELIHGLKQYLGGLDVRFSLDGLAMERCSPFQQRVLRAEHGIPRGHVSTYGRIAGHLGRPGAARGVGRALATNPFPLMIPCHRAVRSDGAIGGYQGGSDMKRALLLMEGVEFDGEKVKMKSVYY
jgi:methylated-DNA-[protein]-cysteine S-methyltransferase